MIGTTILRRTPRSPLLNAAHRSISSTAPRAQRFLIYASDKTEEGILARRFQVRPQHLERIHTFIKNGTFRDGGLIFDPESQPDSGKVAATGSCMILEAETLADAKELVESDIYYTSGVWDPEKLVIVPFIPATLPRA
ncbi:hypothetical protein EDD18DRAFT_1343292 [Armillaria luteobubalina]|uniref:YCII-related domain-containing protein n=1 Tax=Armillaria luteobubalina TaxID=153913 RepID=A0AA39QMT9_9AGAR|nr:hypothetical protein EDD18DRAFT_1343292 [Armillaria luteobubalina]